MARPREPLDLSTYRNRFADRLYNLRNKKGLRVDDVVAAVQSKGLAFSKSALLRLEVGETNPDVNMIPVLAEIYGVSPRGLFPEK